MDKLTYQSELVSYLQEIKKNRKSTISDKKIHLRRFLEWLEQEDLEVEECKYADLLSYVKSLKIRELKTNNINNHLHLVKQFYESQIRLEKLAYNPAVNLKLRGEIERLPHDLLTEKELQNIYTIQVNKTLAEKRDKVILGIFINQGLMRREIERLETTDIDLEKGVIRIRENVKLNERVLPLVTYQIMSLHHYLNHTRLELLKESEGEKGQTLFFNQTENPTIKDHLRRFLRKLRKSNPQLKDFRQIRSSVISKWVKEKNVREAQYYAGFKSVNSIERYKKVDLRDLKMSLAKHHPLQ